MNMHSVYFFKIKCFKANIAAKLRNNTSWGKKQINRTAKHLTGIPRNKKATVGPDELPHVPGGVEGCMCPERRLGRASAI